MAQPNISDTVTKAEDGFYTFTCPSPTGCGPETFNEESRHVSSGWPTAEVAEKRGLQHIQEHLDNIPSQSLEDFRAEQGITLIPGTNTVDLAAYLAKQG